MCFHRLIEEDEYDPSRPGPRSIITEVDPADADWASHIGMQYLIGTREGGTFVRLADNVFVIAVLGGQYLHHDRHLADLSDTKGFSEHTWNLVVEPSDEQMLLVENGDRQYEHFPLDMGRLIYFNSANHHMISRTSTRATSVLVQVDGFGPDESEAAFARISEVLSQRPTPSRL